MLCTAYWHYDYADVHIGGLSLPVVESIRDLDVIVSSDLSSSIHVTDIVTQAHMRACIHVPSFMHLLHMINLLMRAILVNSPNFGV